MYHHRGATEVFRDLEKTKIENKELKEKILILEEELYNTKIMFKKTYSLRTVLSSLWK